MMTTTIISLLILCLFSVPNTNYYVYSPDVIESTNYYIDESQIDNGYINVTVPHDTQLQVYYENKLLTIFPVSQVSNIIKVRFTQLNGNYEIKLVKDKTLVSKHYTIHNMAEDKLTTSSYMTNYNQSQYIKVPNEDITEYTHNYLNYSKKYLIEKNYTPNLDVIILRKEGICTDYCCLAGSLYSLKKIPYRFIYGIRDNELHTWLEIYENNQWIQKDPTFNNLNGEYKKIYEY